MFSFDLSRSIIDYGFDNGTYNSRRLAGRDLQVYNPVANALYFRSSGGSPDKKAYKVKDIKFNGKTLHFFALPQWGGYPQAVR